MSYVHTRTVEIVYDFGFEPAYEKDHLHLALKDVGIVNMTKYDDIIEDIRYEATEETLREYKYTVEIANLTSLEFTNINVADKVMKQLDDQGVEYTYEDVTIETKKMVSPSWRGECLMLEGVPHEMSWRHNKHVISTKDVGHGLDETDVSLQVYLTGYSYQTTLKFVVEWPTSKVQKDSVLEQQLVDLPTPLMGKIQALFEDTAKSVMNKTIGEPMIECRFNVISNHSSECKPSTIAMLREAREQASSEEE